MCCNFPTIKITEGNAFTLIFPLKRRSYVAERPIDEDIDVTRLSDVHVTLGGVEYAPTIETYGVRIDVPATLARGTYDGLLTADYDGNAIRGAYESCVQVVAWNAQSNAQQYILGSPVATKAAYVLGYMPTDAEVEELKQQLREQIAAAEQAEAEAIAEKERYAEAIEHLDDIAKQGDDPAVSLTSLSEIIEGLDISKVAKQGTDRTATNTAIRDKVDEIIATIGGEADVNAVYLGLINRQTDYQAEGFPDQQDLPHLPQAVAAFSARKISNGSAPSDGIPDGVSLAHLLCSTDAANAVTEIKDDNSGWVMDKQFSNAIAPNVKNLTIGAETSTAFRLISGLAELEELTFSNLKSHTNVTSGDADGGWQGGIAQNCPKLKKINMPDTETINATRNNGETSLLFAMNPLLEELNAPKIKSIAGTARTDAYNVFMFNGCPLMKKIVFGAVTRWDPNCIRYAVSNAVYSEIKTFDYLEHLEFGEGTAINLDLRYWNPTDKGTTFLQNFREHIALRLTANGSGLTLTLSQAVRDAIHAAEATYGIEAIIVTQKGWTLSPAPTA